MRQNSRIENVFISCSALFELLMAKCFAMRVFLFILGLLLFHSMNQVDALSADEDPYKILGVSRSANQADIKRAYKKMARNWHPDKNKDPDAQEMFIKINEANEILSDEERRQQFDLLGHAGEPRNERPIYDPHSGFSFFFNGMPFQSSWSQPGHVNFRSYHKTVIPESYEMPYLLEVTSDWCFACAQIEEIWEEASRKIRKVGVGIGTINANRSPRLVDRLGVHSVPSIICVINGQATFYNDRITVQGLKDFVTGLFPSDLIKKVTETNVQTFLTTSINNKPSVILFSPKPLPSLFYHLVAFSHYKRLSFGFVSLMSSSGESLRKRFRASANEPTVMIFKEDVAVPEIIVKASELKSGTLRETIAAHKYLHLPRLSSREMFNELCPEERFRSQRSLCVVLFTKQDQHEQEKLVLRLLTRDNKYLHEKRVQFLYVYEDVQTTLAEELKEGVKEDKCENNSTAPKVVVLWNKGKRELRYDWLAGGWCVSGSQESTSSVRLKSLLDDLLSGQGKLRYTTPIPLIINEHAPGLISMLFSWCKDSFYYIKSSMQRKEAVSIISLIFGVGFILAFSILLPSSSESLERVHRASAKKTPSPPQESTVLGLMQLDHTTEHALISGAPPGHLTFVLLVDAVSVQEATKSPLMQAFADVVHPYTSNPQFKFTWLSIPENLAWCTEVMNVDKFGEVSPGIVLALNGHKNYLSIFKPTDLTKTEFFKSQGGDLMGFDDSGDETDTQEDGLTEYERKRQKVLSFSLHQKLGIWLEKLCDGLVARKRVQEWPRFTD